MRSGLADAGGEAGAVPAVSSGGLGGAEESAADDSHERGSRVHGGGDGSNVKAGRGIDYG